MPSLRVTPTLRALAAATAFLLLATVPPRSSRLLDLLLAALAALVVLAFFLAATALRGLRVERDLPSAGTRGTNVPVVERIVNASSSPAFSLSVEECGIGDDASVAFFDAVPPGRAEARGKLRLAARGCLRLTAARLAATDPFGLFQATRVETLPGEVLVYPRPRRLAARRVLEEARRGHASGSRGLHGRRNAEPASVREYRHGDSPRDVHWRLSAHLGTLVVKTFTQEQSQDALIVLDRTAAFSPEGLAAFERAVSLAAGLGVEILDGGGEIAFVATGSPPVRLERLRGRTGRASLLAVLAVVEPSREAAAELPAAGSRRDAFLVTSRGPRPGTLPTPGPGGVRVVAVEGGPGPRSSRSLIDRYRVRT